MPLVSAQNTRCAIGINYEKYEFNIQLYRSGYRYDTTGHHSLYFLKLPTSEYVYSFPIHRQCSSQHQSSSVTQAATLFEQGYGSLLTLLDHLVAIVLMTTLNLSSRLHHQTTMSRATFQHYSAVAYTVGIMFSTLFAIFLAKLVVIRNRFLQMGRQGLVWISSLPLELFP